MANKKEEKVVNADIAEIKQKRKSEAEAKVKAKKEIIDHREEFRKFFAKNSAKLNLDASMEHILWLHFKASGFAEAGKFEDGLKHFGYKLS